MPMQSMFLTLTPKLCYRRSHYIYIVVIAIAWTTLVGCSSETNLIQKPTTKATLFALNTEQELSNLFTRLCWVSYSPSTFDPTTEPPKWPSEKDIHEDLLILRRAGFNGLVTYSSYYFDENSPGRFVNIPHLAQETEFEAMIIGVWDPVNEDELQFAEQASSYSIVIGYSIGNEGLDIRYDLEALTSATSRLRQTTGKPVSTTEEVYDYHANSPLWTISDWIFPNAHPYFAGLRKPQEAVEWTQSVYHALEMVSDKPLVFKEVGLPTDGDFSLSELHQEQYYQLLGETDVTFVVSAILNSKQR